MSRCLRSCVLLLLVGLSAVRAAQAQSAAQFTFPTNGATGVDLTNLTTWTSVTGAQAYYLYVGTTSGANNLINTGEISRTDWPVCDVPTGQTLYARINTKINNTWSYTDITFTAGTSPQCKATLQQPTAGATEADLRNGFQWTTAPNATVYYLYVGTSVGAKDVVNTGETTQTSYIGYDLPLHQTLYVRLWTKTGVWRYTDSTFTAATAPVGKAAFIFPTDRAIQVDPAPTFKWTTIPNAQSYYLYVGTSVGASNLVSTGEIQPTTYSAPTLPANVTLYARLWTKLGGVWRYVDITFSVRPTGVTATGCSAQPGTMIYGQNWSRGIAPVAMTQPSYISTARASDWGLAYGGPDPVDPLYPEIALADDATVHPGGGPGGENILDSPNGDYSGGGMILQGLGTIPDPFGGPSWWDATEGCVSVAQKWSTAGWDQAFSGERLLAAASDTWFLDGFSLHTDIDSWNEHGYSTGGTLKLTYTLFAGYDTTYQTLYRGSAEINTYRFTRAETENRWQTFQVRWKNGTIDTTGTHVASDGWLRVYCDGALIYDIENIALLMTRENRASSVKPNLLRTIWMGYNGWFGPSTNLEVVDTRGTSCQFRVSPANGGLGGAGGSGGFSVTTTSDCSWSASASASWLHAVTSGQGSGNVTFTADANPTSSWRTAIVTVGNSYNTPAYLLTQGPGTVANPTTDQVVYYHTDAIRSVRLLTDATGATIAGSRRDYLPFGEEWPGRTAIQDERFFEGKERDKETTLDYFGGRYYTSNAGRFTTVDPALNIGQSLTNPQRWNRYAYGLNNPLRYGDPDGREPLPAVLLQFYNAAFGTDFSDVQIRMGIAARFVTNIADSEGVTLSHDIFLAQSSAEDYSTRTLDGVVLVGHELTHVSQYRVLPLCVGMACAGPGFITVYLGEYGANRVRGQSANDAYLNISLEQQAYQVGQRIREFLNQHAEILKKLQNGEALSPGEIELIRRELGRAK